MSANIRTPRIAEPPSPAETEAAGNAAYYDTPGADDFDAMLTAAIQRHEKHAEFLAKQPAEEIGQ